MSDPRVITRLQAQSAQRGFSLSGFLSSVLIIMVVGFLLIKIMPGLLEYWAIDKAVSASKIMAKTPADVRAHFNKIAAAGNIEIIEGKDLDITGTGDEMQIGFAYQKKIHLVGPASLVIDYQSPAASLTSTKN